MYTLNTRVCNMHMHVYLDYVDFNGMRAQGAWIWSP